MESPTMPLNIATAARHESTRAAQPSASSSALQDTSGNEMRSTSAMDLGSGSMKFTPTFGGLQNTSGAQPISMNSSNRERPRRESLAGSMVSGMSWGGNSVGSWIRDDLIMQGTSPFQAYKSPSFHSSSYLPKLEANFMKDFSCCGQTHESMHDLLQHFEEQHAEHPQQSIQRQKSREAAAPPDSRAAIATSTATGIQEGRNLHRPAQIDTFKQHQTTPQPLSAPVTPRVTQKDNQQFSQGFESEDSSVGADDDDVAGMEMDDVSNNIQQSRYPLQNPVAINGASQFGRPASNQVPPLDMNMGNPIYQQHQGLRNYSTPTTPVSTGNRYQNNPTVSSVNTPTLSTYNQSIAHPYQQQQYTPDSSAPGTPGELTSDVLGSMHNLNMGNLGHLNMSNLAEAQINSFGMPFQSGMNTTIADPAVNLLNQNGGLDQARPVDQNGSQKLPDFQYSENSEVAKRIRDAQRKVGVPDPSADGVNKPFHCPVIGCEKAYKNQNGLKYHKSHGHQSHKVLDNGDGTFSIVDPDTEQVYSGTTGMEKYKPYSCDVCGKRYKNLNGLKYHKQHSANCNRGEMPTPTTSRPGTAAGLSR